jgi:VanZ family protein
MNTKNLVTLLLLVFIIAAVLFESTLPATVDSEKIPKLDKLVHFLVFGLIAYLGVFLLNSYKIAGNWLSMVITLVLMLLLGVVVEWLQSFTPGRTATINDVYADVAGAVVFMVVWKSTDFGRS